VIVSLRPQQHAGGQWLRGYAVSSAWARGHPCSTASCPLGAGRSATQPPGGVGPPGQPRVAARATERRLRRGGKIANLPSRLPTRSPTHSSSRACRRVATRLFLPGPKPAIISPTSPRRRPARKGRGRYQGQ
jgi:hypothetical protein